MNNEEKTAQKGTEISPEIPADDLISKLIISSKDPHKTLSVEAAQEILRETRRFIRESFKQDVDYRIVGKGKNQRSSLLKSGAEKLGLKFCFRPEYERLDKVLDWENKIFYFEFRCKLIHIPTGLEIAQAIASCNSREENYRFQWVFKSDLPPETDMASLISKQKESAGGKIYTVYRIENPCIEDQINTIVQMAQKRAYLTAVKNATQTSDEFAEFGGIGNGNGDIKSGRTRSARPSKPSPISSGPPKAEPAPKAGKITLQTKSVILLSLKSDTLTDEERGWIKKRLDSEHARVITDKDLFTEDEGQRIIKYIAFKGKTAEVKEKLFRSFGGDQEQALDFARKALSLNDVDLDKLTNEQLNKLSRAVDKEEEDMPF